MHPKLRRWRLTRQQKVKGLALHPSSLYAVFSAREAVQGEADCLKIYSHTPAISASESQGRNEREKVQIEVLH